MPSVSNKRQQHIHRAIDTPYRETPDCQPCRHWYGQRKDYNSMLRHPAAKDREHPQYAPRSPNSLRLNRLFRPDTLHRSRLRPSAVGLLQHPLPIQRRGVARQRASNPEHEEAARTERSDHQGAKLREPEHVGGEVDGGEMCEAGGQHGVVAPFADVLEGADGVSVD